MSLKASQGTDGFQGSHSRIRSAFPVMANEPSTVLPVAKYQSQGPLLLLALHKVLWCHIGPPESHEVRTEEERCGGEEVGKKKDLKQADGQRQEEREEMGGILNPWIGFSEQRLSNGAILWL